MAKKLTEHHMSAWRLAITLHSRWLALLDEKLTSAHQIPLQWYDVLIELAESTDHRLRMHEVAARVVLSRSGLTRLVDRLEQAGYLQRETDPQDRRGYFLLITAEGLAALRKADPVYLKGIGQLFATHLSAEEAAFLVEIYSRLLGALGDAETKTAE